MVAPPVSTPAILLRKIAYGDFDLILTFLSGSSGKLSVIAKSAVKSKKRFAGILEPFSELQIVHASGRGKGLHVLQEATLVQPFDRIRLDILKTAYASYMAELINDWTEEGHRQEELYRLFRYVLGELDRTETAPGELGVLFQMRLLTLSGLAPALSACLVCKTPLDQLDQSFFSMDLKKGGVICGGCRPGSGSGLALAKGTLKHLLWMADGDLQKAARIRLSARALAEGTAFLEAFVPFHLGREPRSLNVLKQLRT